MRLKNALRKFIKPDTRLDKVAEKFSKIYQENVFGGEVSRSGGGSDMTQTEIIRREIPKLLKQYNIKTFLDAPCGDCYWIRQADLGVAHYIGVDIVREAVEKNARELAASGQREFHCRNLISDDLPKADLIFCRDCLVHLNFRDGQKVIANFKRSGAQYLLATTFTARTTNHYFPDDYADKDSSAQPINFWRPLNMRLAPFNFPEPLMIINEGCTEGDNQFTDKSLGLWRLNDITAG